MQSDFQREDRIFFLKGVRVKCDGCGCNLNGRGHVRVRGRDDGDRDHNCGHVRYYLLVRGGNGHNFHRGCALACCFCYLCCVGRMGFGISGVF